MGVNEETGLSFPDFSKISQAHNMVSNYTKDPKNLRTDILQSLYYQKQCIHEIILNPDQPQAPRSLNRRNPDGTMNPTALEDSYPFLPPEVIEREMQ
jgi:acetolactate synthase-1/2/3 large subunit